MENIPVWARQYLDAESRQAVASAITGAEKKTSGEIVAMVVKQSSAIGHVPVLLSCLWFLAFFALNLWPLQARWLGSSKAWLLLDALLAVLLGEIMSWGAPLRRWFTPKHDQVAQVERRALLEFHLAGLEKTRDQTGVLIFVSLMEKKVVVLADKGIASKLPADAWKDVVSLALAGIKSHGLGHGLCAAVLKCGELLEPHFPIKPDDANELENKLIIKE